MHLKRVSGILLHITSLPGPYGIGDLGAEAYKFIDFLRETNQKIWQILPVTPTEKCSPYSALSAFAGHPLLISLDELVEMNLLTSNDLILPSSYQFNDNYVKFQQVTQYKYSILKKAYENFKQQKTSDVFEEFIRKENHWLDDYCLYMTIKELQNHASWSKWPTELKHRQPLALEKLRETQQDQIQYHIFLQYIFHQQWFKLKQYANQFDIKIIGDMPIYVDYESSDVWVNPDIFQLDEKTLLPTVVSGFPPDDCSSEGQNWNMPIYDWNNKSKQTQVFQWWIKRLEKTLEVVDIVRIDHFRGFESYWAIPVDKNFVPLKPKHGQWIKTPGVEFFNTIVNKLGSNLPLIVEDLGGLSQEVFDLRDQFRLTGIRILQFGFCYHPDNIYRPHNYIHNCIGYTGTHDNSTTIGWWTKYASDDEKKTFLSYVNPPDDGAEGVTIEHLNKHIHWHFIQMVMASIADTIIIQFQDILGLGDSARMNDPSLASNPESDEAQNWCWRFTWSMLTKNSKEKFKFFTNIYNRAGSKNKL